MQAHHNKSLINVHHKILQLLKSTLAALLLLIGVIESVSATHPFDGMSAIDISVAAAMREDTKSTSNQQEAIGTQAEVVSAVDFYRFDIVELKGRFLHEGWYPIPGNPLPGTVTVEAELIGPWQTAQFMLLDEADQLIESITLSVPEESAGSSTFLGTIEVPKRIRRTKTLFHETREY